MSPLDRLRHAFEAKPHGFGLRLIEPGMREHHLRYADLGRLVAGAADGLREAGLSRSDRVLLVMRTTRALLGSYLGALMGGFIPMIVAPPREGDEDVGPAQLRKLAERIDAAAVVCEGDAHSRFEAQIDRPLISGAALCAREMSDRAVAQALVPRGDGRIAHLQATSGTTGVPNIAVVSHDNIAANVQAIGDVLEADAEDVLVSWLPLSHDMGLIGLSYALYWDIPAIFSDPSNFVRQPLAWLDWISRYRGTLSPAPNYAYYMCARMARLRPPRDLRLDHWRAALCGSEPVKEKTFEAFYQAFSPFGLRRSALRPVYGLAEATLAVSMPGGAACYRVDRVAPGTLVAQGAAVPEGGAEESLSFVGLGTAIEGHSLRIAGPNESPLGERAVGEVQVRGPSVIDGYWDDPEATLKLKSADGYLRTGDLGYLAAGELHITGRRKDSIILGGRSFTALEIESLIEQMFPEMDPPVCVATGLLEEDLQTEALHLLLDQRLAAPGERSALARRVRGQLARVFAIVGVHVHWLNLGQMPRSPSGKIQRFQCLAFVRDRSLQCDLADYP